MFERDTVNTMTARLREPRRFMQVMIGPRQVGKTTAIQQVLSRVTIPHHYASADVPAPPMTAWISQQWELARRQLSGTTPAVLVLDEVQKIAHWSTEVKRLWDEDARAERALHVVILGSSSLLIQRGLKESLAGRFELVRAPHWSWPECREAFGWSLEQYLYFGGYPGAAPLIQDEARWTRYVQDALIEPTMARDILLLHRVEKPALLRQLFVLACEYSGQVLSYQKLLGQLAEAGNTTTLAHYQHLLESAHVLRGLPKWSGAALRRRSSSPKWLPLTTGLWTALANRTLAAWRSDGESWGRLIEVAVGAHAVNSGWAQGIDVYYWREGNHEVDFVLRQGRAVLAVEVKSGRRARALPGLAAFQRRYPAARALTVGAGGVTLEEFLTRPVAHWLSAAA